ncbi:MAG: Hsp20/alpha crystallin family protein [Thermodesulfovibrionales bacterium]|nr:Hsp20/alpha crystallin family protein [Thermodesulfovibrionales bacterium]
MKNVLKGLFFYEVDTCRWPLIDLYENNDELVFEVDLPGVEPENISIRVYEDLLIIEGSNINNESGVLKYVCMERGVRNFRRVLKIPGHVNTMEGRAFYAKGVMSIRFPKLKDKLIKIKIERELRK